MKKEDFKSMNEDNYPTFANVSTLLQSSYINLGKIISTCTDQELKAQLQMIEVDLSNIATLLGVF